ncbi:hypothetical protein NL676_017541 [Syzygium grande]|nr:hypothetical protein NL676_017541 [Syzygium grande]
MKSAAFLGEMLCTCFNSVGFTWLASPAATELEMVIMDWLARMLKLPKSFMFAGTRGVVNQNTTSESILLTLCRREGPSIRRYWHRELLKASSLLNQTHSTFTKTCKLAGIHPCNIRSIPTSLHTHFALSHLLFRKVVEADVVAGLVPLYVCVTVGTTSTVAIDRSTSLSTWQTNTTCGSVDAPTASAYICPSFGTTSGIGGRLSESKLAQVAAQL